MKDEKKKSKTKRLIQWWYQSKVRNLPNIKKSLPQTSTA